MKPDQGHCSMEHHSASHGHDGASSFLCNSILVSSINSAKGGALVGCAPKAVAEVLWV